MLAHRCSRALFRALALGVALVGLNAAVVGPGTASATTAALTPNEALATTSGDGAGVMLALGDSLAAGYQPIYGDKPPPVSAQTGRADQGYPGGYARDVATAHHLLLVDLACPGETTASMTGTPANAACLAGYRVSFGATSQMAAAQAFLARYPGKVKLVTVDLGANNVDGCSASQAGVACISKGLTAISKQLPPVLVTLKALVARDDPSAMLMGMNYYDPFLAAEYSPGGLVGTVEGTESVAQTLRLNALLATAFGKVGIPIANVASAFKTGVGSPLVAYHGERLPVDAADICRWTWMCPLKGTKTAPNIHANTTGYSVIASAFNAKLPASFS
jgi:GDSL-like Lipase/Acylhydrolase family